jgi:hypothetical protein
MHLVRILDAHGDTLLTFDPKNHVEVDDVETRFRELMERGFIAFDVSATPGRVIKTFDPRALEVIVTPGFAGG